MELREQLDKVLVSHGARVKVFEQNQNYSQAGNVINEHIDAILDTVIAAIRDSQKNTWAQQPYHDGQEAIIKLLQSAKGQK